MPNVNDDDEETLLFADESEWMDELDPAEVAGGPEHDPYNPLGN